VSEHELRATARETGVVDVQYITSTRVSLIIADLWSLDFEKIGQTSVCTLDSPVSFNLIFFFLGITVNQE